MEFQNWMPLFVYGLSIPLSLFLWLGNVAFSKFLRHNEFDEPSVVIPPTRWLFSTVGPLTLMIIALKRKSVNLSGAVLGVIFAFILSISSHPFFICLAAFFFSSSKATKFMSHAKRKFEKDFKEGEGQRNWVQVLCNGGMATQLAVLYLIDCGSSERPIDFHSHYRSSWLCVAITSAFACCNGDTWASELGSVLSNGDPILITTGKRVPRGTNGGVSLIGCLVSVLGGMLVGLAFYVATWYTVNSSMMLRSPPQWPIIVFGGIGGLFGSLVDSFLGATVQYSGIDSNGKIVEFPGHGVRYISGMRIVDNHSVNLISSIITALSIPFIAAKFWPDR